MHNTYIINVEDTYETRPTSDYAHVVDFFRDKGYLLTGDMLAHRMLWLDADRRNELMIIYWEALDTIGYHIADLAEGGSAAGEWPVTLPGAAERSLGNSRSYNRKRY